MLKTLPVALIMLSIGTISVTGQNNKSEQLGEVTVIASRTIQKANGYVVNLKGTDITKNKPAIDALQLLPAITYESKALKINGLTVSEIYIDGIKINDYSELDNIPANMIDKVEVKYLSEVNQNTSQAGGSILITLRRLPESGFSGSVGGSATALRRQGIGLESLYGAVRGRYGKISFYDYASANWMQLKEWEEQTITDHDKTTRMNTVVNKHCSTLTNRLSLTYDFSPRTYLAGSYYISSQNLRPNSQTAAGGVISAIDQRITSISNEGTLKLSSQLNDKGLTMTLIGDYFNHTRRNLQHFFNPSLADNAFHYKNITDMWEAFADFDIPLTPSMTLNSGVSAKIISSRYRPDNDYSSDRFDTSDFATDTKGLTPMVYASLRGAAGQLRYTAGLNWQLNRIKYTPIDKGEQTKNTQWAINPSIQLMYPFGSGNRHSLSFAYKHLLDNIPYSAISSLVTWEDPYNYSVGNPGLKAPTEHLVTAGVNLFNNLLNLNATYFYDKNAITWETFADPDNPDVFYTKPVNYDGDQSWALRAELNLKPIQQWRLKFTTRLSLNPENVTLGGVHYDKTRFRHIYILNNSFTFRNDWSLTLNADLEPTFHRIDRTYHTVYKVQGSIAKSFINEDLEISVDFAPVSKRRKLDRRADGKTVSLHYTNPEQYVGLNLRYFFRNGKKVNTNIAVGTQQYNEITDNK